MHKIDGAGHVNGTWVNEDVTLNRPPTEITADIMNALQFEIVNVIEAAGLTLSKPQNTQLLTAIQTLIKGGDYKDSVRVASTVPINLAAPGANIDGVAMAAGDRFLEKDHATLALRGIYIWNGAAVPATRALDADTGAEINSGAIIPVESGTVNADTNWQLTTDGTVTIGVTGLSFAILNKSLAIQKFTVNGSFTVPVGINTIYLTAAAGGGGGGGGYSSGANGGSGGGGGASILKSSYAVTPGQVIPITIGAGGSAGAVAGNGGAGGSTIIGALITLTGGGGGIAGSVSSGGTGGGFSGGGLSTAGGDGIAGLPGNGGATAVSGGGPARLGTGVSGTLNSGAGSSGGHATFTGGAGSSGIVIIEY